jgi:hypothetical protein
MVNALLGKLCDIFNVLIRITDGKVKCIGDVRQSKLAKLAQPIKQIRPILPKNGLENF